MRVLELGQFLVPAYAGMLMAEQGHQVTKWVNPNRGDPIQDFIRGDELWAFVNAGKTLITREAALISEEPAGRWDIVIDNLRASAWDRWGIDPATEAVRLGVSWVSMRDEFDGRSFDAVAQARAWGDHVGWVPVYVGDTAGGLWLCFKALASPRPGHYVVRQASALAKLVEGELGVSMRRDGKSTPWSAGDYGPAGDGMTVVYRGEPVHEPFRDEDWRRANLRHRNGRYII